MGKIIKVNRKKLKREIEERDYYPINENLLQSYRRIFISTESFLLAVGVLAWREVNSLLFFSIVLINLLIIVFGWWPIVYSRAKFVDYYKYYIHKKTDCNREDYIHNSEKRKKANQKVGEKGPWRRTRIKLDGVLPFMFFVIWLMLFLSYEVDQDQSVTVLFLSYKIYSNQGVTVWTILGFLLNFFR